MMEGEKVTYYFRFLSFFELIEETQIFLIALNYWDHIEQ